MKLSAVRGVVKGKKVVLVDDSIVRGTTIRRIIHLLKEAEAQEVHVRIASPPLKYPCFYGIDIQTRDELIAANYSIEEIKEQIGADSLAFLSEAGLIDGIQLNYDAPYSGLCMAYFNGDYPTPLYDYEEQYQASLKKKLGGIDMENAYSKAGVNVEAGYEVVERIQKHSQKTQRTGTLGMLGGFGGCFDLSSYKLKEPVLVSGTDGVGTKLLLAIEEQKHETIGIDCVAMCVNDVVAQGAEPLYFLDYLALGTVNPAKVEAIVAGVATGCCEANAALIGGETAEMPDMYEADAYDVAGFAVGIAEKSQLLTPSNVKEGDFLIGLPSSGLHSNGYSLVRNVFLRNIRLKQRTSFQNWHPKR